MPRQTAHIIASLFSKWLARIGVYSEGRNVGTSSLPACKPHIDGFASLQEVFANEVADNERGPGVRIGTRHRESVSQVVSEQRRL